MKSQILHTVLCNIAGEAAGELLDRSLLGVKGLRLLSHHYHTSWLSTVTLRGTVEDGR